MIIGVDDIGEPFAVSNIRPRKIAFSGFTMAIRATALSATIVLAATTHADLSPPVWVRRARAVPEPPLSARGSLGNEVLDGSLIDDEILTAAASVRRLDHKLSDAELESWASRLGRDISS
jgi:hypothetical protein